MDIIWLSESQLNVLLSIVVFFISFSGVLFYIRFRSQRSIIQNERKYTALEAVLSKYAMRVENSTRMLRELRIKMDVIEAKVSAGGGDIERTAVNTITDDIKDDIKSDMNSSVFHEKHEDIMANDIVIMTSQKNITKNGINLTDDKNLHQKTVSTILKLLSQSPMTAREIQFNTKKTREHISRLMKRLYDESLVTRDTDSKPFLYKVTDEGRRLLENHSDM